MSKNINFLVLISFVIALSLAYVAEFFYGLQPCILCLYLRYAYFVILFLTVLRFFWPLESKTARESKTLAAKSLGKKLSLLQLLAIFVAFLLSLTHFGVEQKWWQIHSLCQTPLKLDFKLNNSDKLGHLPPKERIKYLHQNINRAKLSGCDKVSWWFLGFSISFWNLLFLGGWLFLNSLLLILKLSRFNSIK